MATFFILFFDIFICGMVEYTTTRKGICHATKQYILLTAGQVGIRIHEMIANTDYGSAARTKDSNFLPNLTPYSSLSLLGQLFSSQKRSPRAKIVGTSSGTELWHHIQERWFVGISIAHATFP